MSEIENCLADLLTGRPPSVPVPKYDFVFHGPSRTHQRPLVLKDNLTLIVSAVLFDEQYRVALIQEAKESCRGHWYLPAGRVELNETLQEGVQREVTEETGLEFQPTTVVLVESSHLFGYWMRFTFIGSVTGGRLKTLKEADQESLQARWMTIQDIQDQVGIKLRANDVMHQIHTALTYLQRDANERHAPILPTLNAHKHMCIRVVLIKRLQDELHILLCMEGKPHFPIVKGTCIAEEALRTLDKETFSASNGYFLKGVLCIEHLGQPQGSSADGVCLNLLAVTDFQRNLENPNYMWHSITNPELKSLLRIRMQQQRCLKSP